MTRHIILSTGELLGHDWSASRVFSSSWFGDASVNATGRVLTGGRWAYTPIRTDVDAPERNGYGRVTDRMNADPAKVRRRDVRGAPGHLFRRATPTTSQQNYHERRPSSTSRAARARSAGSRRARRCPAATRCASRCARRTSRTSTGRCRVPYSRRIRPLLVVVQRRPSYR